LLSFFSLLFSLFSSFKKTRSTANKFALCSLQNIPFSPKICN
jgi:hypothetical protein